MRAVFLSLFAAAHASDLVVDSSFGLKSPDVKLCGPCFNIGGQGINLLLNKILQGGVVGGCSALCAGAIPAGGLPAIGCEVVCGAVGIKAFVAAIQKADLDPIYMCEALHACPTAPDNASAIVTDIGAAPNPVNKGQTIKMGVQVNVTTATGVGEFRIKVNGPGSATPISQSFFLETGIPAGSQFIAVNLPIKDGTAQHPATFKPGQYNYSFHVCQGMCGSSHPHSKDFGLMNGTFMLTDNKPATTTLAPGASTTARPDCLDFKKPTDCAKAHCHWCTQLGSCHDTVMPHCDIAV